MQVSEIFYSIQGEGYGTGKPAIFLRLAGCHLKCSWCDSKFTWDRKSGETLNTETIIEKISKYPCKRIVLTGGEPLLQQNEIKKLLIQLKRKKYFVELETSGSLETFLNEFIDQYNCSPKLSNSENKKIDYKNSLKSFPKEKTYFKFVVEKKEDIKEIMAFIKRHKLEKEKVYLMPQGITEKEISKKSKWIIETCKLENLNFSQRLHITLWGNIRGV